MGTDELANSIETTVVAIREDLMSYFKGTCVDYMTDHTGLSLNNGYASSYSFRYQRRQRENQEFKIMVLGDRVPIFGLQKAPEKIIFYTGVLNRSKELRKVHELVDEFIRQYLRGVEREEYHGSVWYR